MLLMTVFRFSKKNEAATAIVEVHGKEINGHQVKCSWGKESSDPSQNSNAAQPNQVAAQTVNSTNVTVPNTFLLSTAC